MGWNSPDDFRSFDTTSEISRAASASIVPSLTKSVMAIGSGWMVPCVILSSTTACALSKPAPAPISTQGRRTASRQAFLGSFDVLDERALSCIGSIGFRDSAA
jgi:hypothetical protein